MFSTDAGDEFVEATVCTSDAISPLLGIYDYGDALELLEGLSVEESRGAASEVGMAVAA